MQKILCGVDIGGTKLSTALITDKGRIIDKIYDYDHTVLKENQLVKHVADNINRIIDGNNLQHSDILGIGIGCAGHIRFRDGVIITTSNLNGFKNYPLREAVQSYC